jgi:hypothetical protein
VYFGLPKSEFMACHLDLVILNEVKNLVPSVYSWDCTKPRESIATRFFTSFRMTKHSWPASPGHFLDLASVLAVYCPLPTAHWSTDN